MKGVNVQALGGNVQPLGGNVQPLGGEYKKVDNYVFNPHQGLLGKGAFAAVYKAYDESKNHKEIIVVFLRIFN